MSWLSRILSIPASVGIYAFLRITDRVSPTHRTVEVSYLAERLPTLKMWHQFIDCRRSSDFDRGHVPGALNIPLGAPDVRSRLKALRRQRSTVLTIVYDANGEQIESMQRAMRRARFTPVYYVAGGYEALRADGEALLSPRACFHPMG